MTQDKNKYVDDLIGRVLNEDGRKHLKDEIVADLLQAISILERCSSPEHRQENIQTFTKKFIGMEDISIDDFK